MSDADLVRAVAAGDRGALAALYDRHAALLLAVGLRVLRSRLDAEDLLHDVFLEIWRRAPSYDPQRGTVRAWLLVRTRSRALDRLKSPGYARVVSMETSGVREDQLAVAEDPMNGADGALVRGALGDLPVDQRAVLELAYFEGLSLTEIAERLAVPVGTIKSRLARALGKLRDFLGVSRGSESP